MKSLNNHMGISNKRLSNLSKLRAPEINYNNSISGLSSRNVEGAINELALELQGFTGGTSATPLNEGFLFGSTRQNIGDNTTILGYNSASGHTGSNNRVIIGKNTLKDLNTLGSDYIIAVGNNIGENSSTIGVNSTIIGHNSVLEGCGAYNTIIGSNSFKNVGDNINVTHNTLIGSEILNTNNSNLITDNLIIGTPNFSPAVEPNPAPAVQNNIIVGRNIVYNSSKNVTDNIIIGNNVDCNTQDSIIIHRGLNQYTRDFNNCFVLSKGNPLNYPNNDDQFVIDSDYIDYKILGIGSSNLSVFYFNFSIEDPYSTDPRDIQTPPIPTDLNTRYKQLSNSPVVAGEVQFVYPLTSADPTYTLVSGYAFITPINQLNNIVIPAGTWSVKLWTSTNLTANFPGKFFSRVFTYNNITQNETFLFNTATVPIFGDGLQIQISNYTSGISYSLGADDRLVCKLYVYTDSIPVEVSTYFQGENLFATFEIPPIVIPNDLHFYLGYDELNGRISKHIAKNTNDSLLEARVFKRSTEDGSMRFRTFRGDTGVNVVEDNDSILIYGTGSTGGSAPSAQPTTEGSVFGLTRPLSTADGCTFLGYDTCTSYAAQTPNSNVLDSTVIGTFNLSNLDQTVTNLQNNVILGHSLLPDVSSFSQISGNFIVGGPAGSTLTQLNNSNLIGMGSAIYDTLLSSRSLVANVNMLSSNQNTFASGNLTTGIVILGNSQNLGVANKSICVGAGSSNQMNSLAGIVFNQGLTTYNNNNFENCCAFIGVNPADATNDDQFIISHTELYSPNLGSGTPAGNGQRLLYYDPTSGLIRPASTSGAYKRVSSYTGNTDSAGQIVFNLAPLSLSSSPIVSCSVRNTSQVNWFNCHVFSLSSTSCSVQVFQNGSPAGSNITVHLIVTY